jgi:hypothetical protein
MNSLHPSVETATEPRCDDSDAFAAWFSTEGDALLESMQGLGSASELIKQPQHGLNWWPC